MGPIDMQAAARQTLNLLVLCTIALAAAQSDLPDEGARTSGEILENLLDEPKNPDAKLLKFLTPLDENMAVTGHQSDLATGTCRDVCYKDGCKGTRTNPIPRNKRW